MLRLIGLTLSSVVIATGCFLATTPWRVHGGRFITEYALLGGAVGAVGLIGLALSWRYGS